MFSTSFSTIDTYGVFANKPVGKLDDLKGMKLDAAGPNALYIKPVGAVGVAGSLVSYYNDIKTGVADGAIIWMEAAITFKIGEVAPHYLKSDFGTGVNKAITVNKDVWSKLPDEVKKALQEVAPLYRDHVAQVTLEYRRQVDQGLPRKGRQDRRTDARRAPQMGDEPAQYRQVLGGRRREARMPGHKFLTAYMDALRAAGEKPVRNWDKE